MLRRDAIALLVAAAAPAPRRAVILLDVRTRQVLTAQNPELIAPPGSTLKPLVFSTLLRAKKLDPGEAFPCTGRLEIGGRRVPFGAESRVDRPAGIDAEAAGVFDVAAR